MIMSTRGGEPTLARPIENSERIYTFLTPEALAQLKTKAKSMGMSVSGLIRMIILDYLQENGKTS